MSNVFYMRDALLEIEAVINFYNVQIEMTLHWMSVWSLVLRCIVIINVLVLRCVVIINVQMTLFGHLVRLIIINRAECGSYSMTLWGSLWCIYPAVHSPREVYTSFTREIWTHLLIMWSSYIPRTLDSEYPGPWSLFRLHPPHYAYRTVWVLHRRQYEKHKRISNWRKMWTTCPSRVQEVDVDTISGILRCCHLCPCQSMLLLLHRTEFALDVNVVVLL